jgi:hypothetical protein
MVQRFVDETLHHQRFRDETPHRAGRHRPAGRFL